MAESNSLTTKVYRSGKLHVPLSAVPSRRHPTRGQPLQEHVWTWLPPLRLNLIADQAYRAAKQSCVPPAGEAFVVDGVAYADKDTFAEALVSEFRNLVYLRLGKLQGGVEHLLSMPADALRAVGQVGEAA